MHRVGPILVIQYTVRTAKRRNVCPATCSLLRQSRSQFSYRQESKSKTRKKKGKKEKTKNRLYSELAINRILVIILYHIRVIFLVVLIHM